MASKDPKFPLSLIKNAQYYGFLLVTIVGFILVVGSMIFSSFDKLIEGIDKEKAIFLYVSGIGFLLTFERLGIIKHIQGSLENIDTRTKSSAKSLNRIKGNMPYTAYLADKASIYTEGIHLVSLARDSIRATAFGKQDWDGPNDYLEQIANAGRRNNGFYYHVLFGFDKDDLRRLEHILRRYELFNVSGRSQQMAAKESDEQLRLDLLLIDSKHMLIAFHTIQDNSFHFGITFENQPELVTRAEDWFDNILWQNAKKSLTRDEVEERIAKIRGRIDDQQAQGKKRG